MSQDGHLMKAALELAKVLNESVDEHLPQKLASMVKLHAGLAVGSVLIPIPGADIAASAVNIWTMYIRINKELHLPFREHIVRSVATGVATNIGANAAALLVVGSVLKFIPGLGSVGGAAVMAGTVYAVTIAAGIVYLKAITHLLLKKAAANVTDSDLKAATDEVLRDKTEIKDILKESKANYRVDKANLDSSPERM
jgi:uncharacterized protein (DUF697 family)